MAAKSDTVEAGTLNFWLTTTAVTRPSAAGWTICLGTTSGTPGGGAGTNPPDESAIFVPLANDGPAGFTNHQTITFGTPTSLESTTWAHEIANDIAASWGPSNSAWNSSSPITHFGVYGTISGTPTLLYWGLLDNSRTVAAGGETITINTGALKIREA